MSAQHSEAFPVTQDFVIEAHQQFTELALVPAIKPHIGTAEAEYLLERNSLLSRQAAHVGVLQSVYELMEIAPEADISPRPEVLCEAIIELKFALKALDRTRANTHLDEYLAEQPGEETVAAAETVLEELLPIADEQCEPEAGQIELEVTQVLAEKSQAAIIPSPRKQSDGWVPLNGRSLLENLPAQTYTSEDIDETPLAWQEEALCAQTDPDTFFPEKGGSTREAKKICIGCEVKSECLEYALSQHEYFGIWGGLSERERRRLKHESA